MNSDKLLDAIGMVDDDLLVQEKRTVIPFRRKLTVLVAAALILADKSDVRTSRVRNKNTVYTDIHDRVNYAVTDTKLNINLEKKVISLELQIDEDICTMYEYFDIFLGRMMMCRAAAQMLDAKFRLTVNGGKVL